jgi:hypothetical protein
MMICRRVLVAVLLVLPLLAIGLTTYAVSLRALAVALIGSSLRIHSATDAQHELAEWRGRPLAQIIDRPLAPGGDKSYGVLLTNTLLSRLRVAQPTMAEMVITMRGTELRSITLRMVSERVGLSAVSSVEWFSPGSPRGGYHVDGRRPSWAVVEFLSGMSDPPKGARRSRST